MAQTETSINIPQLLAVALVGFFAIRWYLNKPPGGASSPGSLDRTDAMNSAEKGERLAGDTSAPCKSALPMVNRS